MTRKIKKALADSIKHWFENLDLIEKGWFSYSDISGDRCALCRIRESRCANCPLREYGMKCTTSLPDHKPWSSPWDDVANALDANDPVRIINATTIMLTCLLLIWFAEGGE